MDKKLFKTLEYLEPLIEEMGFERLEDYCKCYLKLNFDKDTFYYDFKEYVEGHNKISINSFKTFLLDKKDIDFIEILEMIDKHNK